MCGTATDLPTGSQRESTTNESDLGSRINELKLVSNRCNGNNAGGIMMMEEGCGVEIQRRSVQYCTMYSTVVTVRTAL